MQIVTPNLETLTARVRAIMPELKIDRLERNQEGLINDVLIVNRKYVFRFARNEKYAEILNTELGILDLIRPRVGINVPTPIYRGIDCVVYPFVQGESLTRESIQKMDQRARASIGAQLGDFLYQMHNVDISGSGTELPSTSAPVHRDTWLDIRHRVQEKVYPLLLKHQIQWADKLFDSMLAVPNAFDFTPVLIHGDLASYHILFDPHENKVTGVIDFGVAGKGDAALDLGNLMTTYGESFIQLMRPTYPVLEIYLPRARFYAQSIELQWVLLGLENGETFWFTAHLGGARDVGF